MGEQKERNVSWRLASELLTREAQRSISFQYKTCKPNRDDRANFGEKTQTEVVHSRDTITWTRQDYPTWNMTRRETKVQTEKTMGRQH